MMAIVVKSIKPKKIKLPVFEQEILVGMDDIADGMEEDFEATVKTWKNKPDFETIKDTTGGELAVLVGTDDEIYGYVNDGTKPHQIRVKHAKFLAFQTGYKAKTTPKVIGSQPGGAFGPFAFAKEVRHPGTDAREFDEEIAKKWAPRMKRRMEKAMRIAVQKSGHKI